MMGTRKRIISIAAIVLMLGVAPTLVACSGNPVEDMVNQGLKQGLGTDAPDIDMNSDGGLPDGYPSDDVPIIDGEISSGFSATQDGQTIYTVQVKAPGGLQSAKEKLIAAGFEVGSDVSQDGTGLVTLEKEPYSVSLTGSDDGVLYLVALKSPSS